MASLTVDVARIFPVGTSVSTYPFDGDLDGQPSGTAVDTDVVPANGIVSFDNLTIGGTYWVVGTVSGTLRRLMIYMPQPNPATLGDLNTELFAHENSHSVHGIPDTALLATLAQVALKIDVAQEGIPFGIAQLGSDGKLLPSQSVAGAQLYKGTWNPATQTPTLANGTGSPGDTYLVTAPATGVLGQNWAVGDSAVYSGTVWQPVSGNLVQSVATLTGAITAANLRTQLSINNTDNTSDANKIVSGPQQTALNLKQDVDADLTALLTVLSATANKAPVVNAAGAWIMTDFSALARLVVAATTAVAMRAQLGAAASLLTINPQTTSYTLLATDFPDTVIEMNLGTALVVTIPNNATMPVSVGSTVEVFRRGAGAVTFTPQSPVVIRSPQSLLAIADQYGTVSLRKRDVDTWVLSGDLG